MRMETRHYQYDSPFSRLTLFNKLITQVLGKVCRYFELRELNGGSGEMCGVRPKSYMLLIYCYYHLYIKW